jgi:hypothetical protein
VDRPNSREDSQTVDPSNLRSKSRASKDNRNKSNNRDRSRNLHSKKRIRRRKLDKIKTLFSRVF